LNYGCNEKHLCIDETAKFENQYSAAIAFCGLYNGCTFNANYTVGTFRKYVKKNVDPKEKKIIANNMAYGDFSYEDFRAVMMQSVPVKYLMRFKLMQDVLDARFYNLTFEQFKKTNQFSKVEIPSFISKKEPKYWAVKTNDIWNIATYVDYDLLPETLFFKFINRWAKDSYRSFQRRKSIKNHIISKTEAATKKTKNKFLKKTAMFGARLVKKATGYYHNRAIFFIKRLTRVVSHSYALFIKMARSIVKFNKAKKWVASLRTKFSGKLTNAKKFFLKKFSSARKFGKLFKKFKGKAISKVGKKLFKNIFKHSKRVKALFKNKCRATKRKSKKGKNSAGKKNKTAKKSKKAATKKSTKSAKKPNKN